MKKLIMIFKSEHFEALTGVILFGALLMIFPSVTAQGVRDGLSLCASTVIPSLFPFTVLCTFTVKSGVCDTLGKVFDPFTRKLLRLRGNTAGAVIMGLVGGFPTGARMTAQLLDEGRISRDEAYRMMMFCVNAGPAFVIGAVGTSMLSDAATGTVIYCSLCVSSLIVGILSGFLADTSADITENAQSRLTETDTQKSIVESVNESASAMLSICAWVILFTCICSALTLLPESLSGALLPLKCVLEVTSGCRDAISVGISIPVVAAIIGWSGVSVHCQVLGCVRKAGMKLSVFLVSRLVNGALAAVICKCLLRFIPCGTSVFLNNTSPVPKLFAYSAPASAGLLMMCALLILDTADIFSGNNNQSSKR